MGGLHCHCGESFKSWIRLQYHQAKEHKKNNDFLKYNITPNDYSKLWKATREPLEDVLKDQTGNVGY